MRTRETVSLFALLLAALAAFLAQDWLKDQYERLVSFVAPFVNLVLIVAAVLVLLVSIAAVLRVVDWLADMKANSKHDREMKRIERQRAEREANTWTDIAPPGSLIIRHTTNDYQIVSEPLHTAAGRVNGSPSAFKPDELQRWAIHTLANAQARAGGKMLPAPEPVEVIEPLLPKLVNAQRLIIAGGSDAGKSTLAKHLIAARADHSHIIPIDPHSPSKLLGYDVIGAGRRYDAIGDALESLVLMMTDRYTDVAGGVFGYGDHQRITVLVDEWTSINENIPEAGRLLKTLLTESRKVNMHLVIMVHSLTSNVLGIDAQIRASAMQVQLEGGNGEPRRSYILPLGKGPNSSRKEWSEYTLPGPFAGYVEPAAEVVVELPDKLELKARAMAASGATPTAIARELLNSGNKATGPQIRQIKAILATLEAT